jgi:hypothetical protein
MTPVEILEQARRGSVVAISKDDLASLLEMAETFREDKTSIAGFIRTLHAGGLVLVQERTPKGEHLVRELASEEEARRFVEARLADYERMWDG